MLPNKDLIIALVGQPNVGKSVVMNHLTGTKAMVSNYPGTTVEITEARFQAGGRQVRVLDTPGIYSLHSDTEEQRVTHRVLLEEDIDLIINIVDASNLARNLYLTFQLLDFNIPMVIALNQMDMTVELGISVDARKLSELTGLQVIPMVAIRDEGIDRLRQYVRRALDGMSPPLGRPMTFSPQVESVIGQLQEHLTLMIPDEGGKHLSHPLRALAIHLLEHDRLDESLLKIYPQISDVIETLQKKMAQGDFLCDNCFRGCALCPRNEEHPPLVTCLERSRSAKETAAKVTRRFGRGSISIRARLENLLDRPFPGIPVLLLVALASITGISWFMEISEGIVSAIFEPLTGYFAYLGTVASGKGVLEIVVAAIPDGLLMPISIVLPAMIGIYTVMAILEDTGLLPRIAVATDRLLSPFGIPGQAIIPLILGFGCKVPAVLSARTIPGKHSRLVLTALLAVTVPCAATVGAILGMAQEFGADLMTIYVSIVVVFLIVGVIIGKFVPREERDIALEIPPLRGPVLRDVILKLWMRLKGFFSQVLPILVLTSIGVRVLMQMGLFAPLARIGAVSTRLFGISGEALAALLVSSIQRYMGPVVLLSLPLTAREATIAGAMICVSIPCLPVSVLIVKENGWRALSAVLAVAVIASLSVGFALNAFLPAL